MKFALLSIGLMKWLSHSPNARKKDEKDPDRLESESPLRHFLAEWPWASHFNAGSLDFLAQSCDRNPATLICLL